jgi:putative acyl-CoA dehydrogenase
MGISTDHGIHARPWREPGPGAHASRAAAMIVMSGLEAGHGCPISMTYAAVPALRAEPEVAAEWEPKLTALDHDPRLAPLRYKRAALAGWP